MADQITVELANFDELRQALTNAPQLMFTYARQEMKRFSNRFQKRFIRERLGGRPGILWSGRRKLGKNVTTNTLGTSLDSLAIEARLSKFLRVHEEGATIRPTHGPFLYLHSRGRGGKTGKITGRVRSVTVPARLGWRTMFESAVRTDLTPRLVDASGRAMRVTLERNLRAIGSGLVRGVRTLA